MTVFSSIGSTNTAVDPSEREALLAAVGTNTSSMGNTHESAFWDEESCLDMNGNYIGVQPRPSTNGDLNV